MDFASEPWYEMVAVTIDALHAEQGREPTVHTIATMAYMAREVPGTTVDQLRAWLDAQPHPGPPPPPPPPPGPHDMINVGAATFVNASEIATWPVTAAITAVTFTPSNTVIAFTKADGPGRWPDVTPPGWDGPLQYTICLGRYLNGQWIVGAFIQMWYGRDGVGDAPSDYARNWFYMSPALLAGGPIAPGEPIGLMVVAGNMRIGLTPTVSVRERSNFVTLRATDDGTVTFPG